MSSTFTFAQDVVMILIYSNLYSPGNIGTFNVTDDLLNAWTETNTGSNIPSLKAGNLSAQKISDRFLRDASYVRLRNAQIGYRVPKEYLAKVFLTDVYNSLQGETCLTLLNGKVLILRAQEIMMYTYPTARQFTLGVDLKF
jgi:hypothetical protein